MAKSQIVISQSNSGLTSAPGVALRALDLYSGAGDEITFQNYDNTGVTQWEWTLIERPPGSVASLVGAAGSVCTLNADVYGRYVVALRVNGLGDDTTGYSITVAGVSYPGSSLALPSGDYLGDWDIPAYSERDNANWIDFYGANAYGAQREVYRILKQLREFMTYNNIFSGSEPGTIVVPFSLPGSLTQNTNVAGYTVIAAYSFLMSIPDFISDAWFCAVMSKSGGGGDTAGVRLYDETNAVSVADLTDNTGNVVTRTAQLTIGSAAGNLRNDGPTRYSVRIESNPGGGGDECNLYSAMLMLFAAEQSSVLV